MSTAWPQPFTLLPAVDVAAGQAVRLVRGEAGSQTCYGDPVQAALAWQQAGASWVHLVDLDAAFGRGSNAALIAEVVRRLDIAVELSGGIRDDDSLAAALATGCARVNIGTAALERPDWVRVGHRQPTGERIAVGLDVRGTRLAARGWTADGGELTDVLDRLEAEGCARYVVTDVTRDGTLTGCNLDLLRLVCARTGRPGHRQRRACPAWTTCVRSPRWLRWAWRARSSGKALYAGKFTLEQALEAVAA